MSSGYWRMRKQQEQSLPGKTITERINGYVGIWMDRCYQNGIPDEIHKKLMASNRVPSYKAIAHAILRNDHNLLSLGFAQRETDLVFELLERSKERDGE